MTMRAGDVVLHRPTGETWVLAWGDTERGEVSACGWPESIAKMADCDLVEACTDEAHVAMLRTWAVKSDSDYRSSVCRRQLEALPAAEPPTGGPLAQRLWCPQCGRDPRLDEDGCCGACGATTGQVPDVEPLQTRIRELEASLQAADGDLAVAGRSFDNMVTCWEKAKAERDEARLALAQIKERLLNSVRCALGEPLALVPSNLPVEAAPAAPVEEVRWCWWRDDRPERPSEPFPTREEALGNALELEETSVWVGRVRECRPEDWVSPDLDAVLERMDEHFGEFVSVDDDVFVVPTGKEGAAEAALGKALAEWARVWVVSETDWYSDANGAELVNLAAGPAPPPEPASDCPICCHADGQGHESYCPRGETDQ